jgi:hypothetical protein
MKYQGKEVRRSLCVFVRVRVRTHPMSRSSLPPYLLTSGPGTPSRHAKRGKNLTMRQTCTKLTLEGGREALK